jgi:tRNA pseudouridine65 synthase
MQVLRDQLGRWVYPLHRLDKATSGVLVFALDREIARHMTEIFTDGRVAKSYCAVVRGFTDDSGLIAHPLKEPRDRMADHRTDPDRPAREAVTEYRRLATVELPHPVGRYATARYSLIAATPRTGRMHQIRRHLKHIFHPVIGDTTYGDGKQNAFFRIRFRCNRLLLHARQIAFMHPLSGQHISICAPLDDAFIAVLRGLQWEGVTMLG